VTFFESLFVVGGGASFRAWTDDGQSFVDDDDARDARDA